MWKIIQQLLPFLIIILLVTQYIIPVVFGTKTWWLFRRKKSVNLDLSNELNRAKDIAGNAKEEIAKVKDKLKENLNTAENMKKEGDNLL